MVAEARAFEGAALRCVTFAVFGPAARDAFQRALSA